MPTPTLAAVEEADEERCEELVMAWGLGRKGTPGEEGEAADDDVGGGAGSIGTPPCTSS